MDRAYSVTMGDRGRLVVPAQVRQHAGLTAGAHCCAVTWSEVSQKVRAAGGDWGLARALLDSYKLGVLDATAADAEWAAMRWQAGQGPSLADRFCLALGERLDADMLTADTAWGTSGRVHQIR
ncbi:MAG: type II toxin-antitoxin system VapC family toxin [Cellulomonas sp.]|nr:type II toxin-antitoxin system VapC family toxin [Cellulomonas sp.]